jgi:hypothetical protein
VAASSLRDARRHLRDCFPIGQVAVGRLVARRVTPHVTRDALADRAGHTRAPGTRRSHAGQPARAPDRAARTRGTVRNP